MVFSVPPVYDGIVAHNEKKEKPPWKHLPGRLFGFFMTLDFANIF